MPASDKELADLYTDLESDRVERKASSNDLEKIREAICAFSNDLPNHKLPGYVLVGQNNDGSCAHGAVTDRLLLNLSGIRSEGLILPLPTMTVEKRLVQGCELAVIAVEPSDRPPVRLRGRTWIRVGPRRAIATLDEERRLTEKQRWRNLPFDSRPFDGASLEDLNLEKFEAEFLPSAFSRETIAQNGRSAEEKLRALRLTSPDNIPTASAIILFGKNPRSLLPGFYIQFLRIDGNAILDPILDQKEISGNLVDVAHQVDQLIRINNRRNAAIGEGLRDEADEYPAVAIEQIFRNALIHRNYEGSNSPVRVYWFSNKIEIHSPGGLYGEVTPETIWRGATSYRNPLLAECAKSLGLVERFGFGLAKTKSALLENGNPEIAGEFVETFVAFSMERRS